MSDTRPADCRQRLIDEGKAYPQSSCTACSMSVFHPRFGDGCVALSALMLQKRTLAEQVAYCADTLDAQLAPPQKIADGVSLALRQIATEIEVLERALRDNEGPQPPRIEEQIGIGWQAALHSGGVKMTVINFVVVSGTLRSVTCAWHDDENRPQLADYPFGALRLAPPAAQ